MEFPKQEAEGVTAKELYGPSINTSSDNMRNMKVLSIIKVYKHVSLVFEREVVIWATTKEINAKDLRDPFSACRWWMFWVSNFCTASLSPPLATSSAARSSNKLPAKHRFRLLRDAFHPADLSRILFKGLICCLTVGSFRLPVRAASLFNEHCGWGLHIKIWSSWCVNRLMKAAVSGPGSPSLGDKWVDFSCVTWRQVAQGPETEPNDLFGEPGQEGA